jgi:hypothetical protein
VGGASLANCLACPTGSLCSGATVSPVTCAQRFGGGGAQRAEHLTSAVGSAEPADCVCLEGYYDTTDSADERQCLVCPPASKCDEVGITRASLPVMEQCRA